MTSTVLIRDSEQRLAALELANTVRFARAALKVRMHAGQVKAADVLADPPAYTLTMKVTTLLAAVPRFGPSKVGKLMRRGRISDAKTVGGLSVRQRHVLIFLLGEIDA